MGQVYFVALGGRVGGALGLNGAVLDEGAVQSV
jgi:hypothetical protein